MADGEKRIKELEEITALTSNDYFVVDSSASGGETKKYKATNITDIIDNIPELVAEFEPNHYYDRDALVAHEGKVYYHNAPGASYEEFPTGYQFIQIDLTGLLSRLGFGISIQHNSSFTYNKGDYCMEDYILYRCLNDNVTGAWSSSDWERASLGYDLSSIYKPRLDEHDEQIEEALVLGTASGSIATFTDGSTLPMRKLEVAIEPQQDLHGYDNPWVGGAGKNKFDATTLMANVNSSVQYVTITLKPNTTYTMSTSLGKIDNVCNLFFMLPNESASSASNGVYSGLSISVTSGNDGQVKVGYRLPSDGTTSAQYLAKQYQIEEGSIATSYAPYSNICPISGWDECNVGVVGKNLFDKTTFTVKKFVQATGNIESSDNWSISAYINVKENQSYILSGVTNAGTAAYHAFYDKNKNFIGSILSTTQTFTTPSNACFVRLSMRTETPNEVQFEFGSTATSYESYNQNSNTYTIDLDGTRYGGTLDVVSGVLTVDRGYVDLGSLIWGASSAGSRFYATVPSPYYKMTTDAKFICSQYIDDGIGSSARGYYGNNGTVRHNYTLNPSPSAYEIYIHDDRFGTDANEFKTAMNGVQLVYELATPQTIQLTPTEVNSLLATNNVFADTGDILDATYVRNANITINDLIRRIENLENA